MFPSSYTSLFSLVCSQVAIINCTSTNKGFGLASIFFIEKKCLFIILNNVLIRGVALHRACYNQWLKVRNLAYFDAFTKLVSENLFHFSPIKILHFLCKFCRIKKAC